MRSNGSFRPRGIEDLRDEQLDVIERNLQRYLDEDHASEESYDEDRYKQWQAKQNELLNKK